MQFANPQLLYLLLPLLLLYSLLKKIITNRETKLSAFISPKLLTQLLETDSKLVTKRTQLLAFSIALAFFIVSLAQPQWGFEWRERSQSGVDIVIAIDVSSSMLAADIKPTRLEQARREIIDLLAKLQGDRVALVSFAGVAFVESPLTLDYTAFTLFLNSLTPDLIPVGGTNIQLALEESIQVLSEPSSKSRAKAIILITDGEEFDGDATDSFDSLKEMGVQLYVMGIGSSEGAPIPSARGYKKDKQGKVIISRLKPKLLEKLAAESGGVYVESSVSERDTQKLYELGIKKQLKAKSIEWGSAKLWNEYYQLPLFISIICLLFCWIPQRRMNQKQATTVSITILVLGFSTIFMPTRVIAEDAEKLAAEAKTAFSNAEFSSSYSKFENASKLNPSDPRLSSGKAANLYRQGEYDKAHRLYLQAAKQSKSSEEQAKQLYNAANSLMQLEQYKEAAELYKQSNELLPNDPDVTNNLTYVRKLIPPKQEESSDDKKDKEQQDKGENDKDQSEENKQNKADDKQQKNKDDKENKGKPDSKQDSDEKSSDSDDNPSDPEKKSDKESKQNKDSKDKNETEQKDNKSSAKDKEKSTQKTGSESGDGKEKALSSQELMQLRSVQEQRGAQIQYRAEKAMQQLNELKQNLPEKDW